MRVPNDIKSTYVDLDTASDLIDKWVLEKKENTVVVVDAHRYRNPFLKPVLDKSLRIFTHRDPPGPKDYVWARHIVTDPLYTKWFGLPLDAIRRIGGGEWVSEHKLDLTYANFEPRNGVVFEQDIKTQNRKQSDGLRGRWKVNDGVYWVDPGLAAGSYKLPSDGFEASRKRLIDILTSTLTIPSVTGAEHIICVWGSLDLAAGAHRSITTARIGGTPVGVSYVVTDEFPLPTTFEPGRTTLFIDSEGMSEYFLAEWINMYGYRFNKVFISRRFSEARDTTSSAPAGVNVSREDPALGPVDADVDNSLTNHGTMAPLRAGEHVNVSRDRARLCTLDETDKNTYSSTNYDSVAELASWRAPQETSTASPEILDTLRGGEQVNVSRDPLESVGPLGPRGEKKNDSGKPDYSLLPWHALEEVVRVLTYGAQKYSRDNYKGIPQMTERYTAAALRHISLANRGESHDSESGLRHTAHAVANLLFILELDLKSSREKSNNSQP